MNIRFEIWNHHDILMDPTTRYPDAVSDEGDMMVALREFCSGVTNSRFVDLVVHDLVTGEWHEIAMKNVGWQQDFRQSSERNFTRARCVRVV